MNSFSKFLELNELEQELFKTTKVMFRHAWDKKEKDDEILVLKMVLGNIVSTELFIANILMMNAVVEYFSLIFNINQETLKKESDLVLAELRKTVDKIRGGKWEKEKEVALYLSLIKLLKEMSYLLISAILDINYDSAGKIGAEIIERDEDLKNNV